MTTTAIAFHDHEPVGPDLLSTVTHGLSQPQKRIPPKFFYDERGSQLFDAICAQPEYYVPDVERRILQRLAPELRDAIGAGCVLIEPGAGAAAKVRELLPVLEPAAYVPIDISGPYLKQVAHDLAADFPGLAIHAACDDFTRDFRLPPDLPAGRRLCFFPGSTLGNFDPQEASTHLRRFAKHVGPEGLLLIGVDTKKPAEVLHAAYNDAAGITASFNRNLLERLNRELDADFAVEHFEHEAFYNADAGRVEMHLVSRREQSVTIGEQTFRFNPGERLHTESSYKYRPQEFLTMAREAGLVDRRHWLDERGYFGVYLLGLPVS